MKIIHLFTVCLLSLAACRSGNAPQSAANRGITDSTRIVSLNGTLTEILCDLGYEKNIAGVDVASTWPRSVLQKPKVGHNRNLAPEAIVALRPDIIVGVADQMTPALVAQLQSTGARVIVFKPEHSVAGAKALIQGVADSIHHTGDVQPLLGSIDQQASLKTALPAQPKVMFIYARGTGTLMVAGNNTPASSMIALAGGTNAVTTYDNFKPLTSEALVAANPDVMLLFDSGLASLGGIEGLLAVPGVAQTTAGKARRVVEMDGQLLTGFGPRTGAAIAALSKSLDEVLRH